MSNIIVLNDVNNALEYQFELTRHSGKLKTLKKGNQVLNSNDRMHFAVKHEISAYLRHLSSQTVSKTHPPFSKGHPCYTAKNPCSVLVTVNPPTHGRFDPANLYPTVKALIDGMTDAGVWEDDNSKVIRLLGFQSGKVNKKQKIYN